MKFAHLHCHSQYSLLDGLPKIDELVDYAKKLDLYALALTDHGVLYGAVEFYQKAKEKGLKPIIGTEMYIAVDKMTQRRPNIDNKRYHMVLLAKNETGYRNLVKLVTKAHLEGFYYKPRIDEDLLSQHTEGLIGFSGCLQGKIPQLIIANKIEEAKKTALKYKEIFGKDNFYLEVQPHPNIKEQLKVNEALKKFSKELDIPLVATVDSHYLRKEDTKAQDILMLINTGADPNDPERLTMISDDFSLKSPKEIADFFKDTPEAIENTVKIADSCNFEFKLGETKLPHFPLPEGKTDKDFLRELCEKGLKEKYGSNPPSEVKKRLEYELSVIEKMGFSSYFLIVQDFVNWAKKNKIVVGPGRGSAPGSLVSYLLGITNIDPIKYNLLFERFLNPGRISFPDIDVDFADVRRDEVIDYLSQKYGRNKVAQIITFGTMAARAVVRDVGRALGYPYSFCDKIAKIIPFGFTLEQTLKTIPEFRQIYETDERATKLIDFAKKLEGVARHASTHACGVVVSNESLDNTVPLQHPPQSDKTIVTQYDMKSIEVLGLLKIDLLGLKNLTIIENTLFLISKLKGKKINLEKIPLDDKKTFELFKKAETTGVFQLESSGMKRYLKELKPSRFEDIIAMIALYRPGPMELIPTYIRRKNKLEKISYLHPKLKPILEETYGIIVYQEQVMKIVQEIAGFSLSEADILRKAIGKKIKSLLIAQKEKFISGALKNKTPKEVAEKIWKWIEPFARYSFNKSHATSYAFIAYQTAYLKAHHPLEFMTSLLNSEKHNIDRITILVEECKKTGIDVLPPDINESYKDFTALPEKNKIRFGLLAIKNVGENIVENIIEERKRNGKFKSISDFASRIDSNNLNKKSLESLIKAGAFDKLEERKKLLSNIEKILEFNREMRRTKENHQNGLFDHHTFSLKLEESKPASFEEKISWERELLGLYISGHPVQRFEKILKKRTISIRELKESNLVGKKVVIGGIISEIKKIITKNGKPMLFLKIEDISDKIEVIVFPNVIESNPLTFQEKKIVFVTGRFDMKDEEPKLICEQIEEIMEAP